MEGSKKYGLGSIEHGDHLINPEEKGKLRGDLSVGEAQERADIENRFGGFARGHSAIEAGFKTMTKEELIMTRDLLQSEITKAQLLLTWTGQELNERRGKEQSDKLKSQMS